MDRNSYDAAPTGQQAESAVISWLRHQTTACKNMKIPRIKGKQREVRRRLTGVSQPVEPVVDKFTKPTIETPRSLG